MKPYINTLSIYSILYLYLTAIHMKYACKHGFVIPEHLFSFHDHILDGHDLRHIPFDVITCYYF